MSRIVLTGATGLLGTRALTLLRERHEIHAIVRSLPATPLDGVEYHEKDLSQPWTTNGLPEKVDAVFHLAQSRSFRDFPENALETYWVNTGATAILLDYAARAGAQRFVLASTGGLYGPCERPITEDTSLSPPSGPLSHYFNTKLSAEVLTGAYSKICNVTILRPFFIYGRGQAGDKLVPRLVASVSNGAPIHLVGENGMQINPVHVDDAASALLATLSLANSQTLNVAGPQPVTIREIAERIGSLIGRHPNFVVGEGNPERVVADVGRIQSVLGRPLISFDEGIRSMLAA